MEERSYDLKYNQNLIKPLGDSCGYDENTAIAELIDNSLGAKATVVNILYDSEKKILTVEDNGFGMDLKTLRENYFACGYSSTIYEEMASGKFGLGGKAAPMYLGGENIGPITIETGNLSKDTHIIATWDPTKSTDACSDKEVSGTFEGTRISFPVGKEIDFEKLKTFISVTYCWKIVNENIEINVKKSSDEVFATTLLPEDPLYRNNEFVKNHNMISRRKNFRIPFYDAAKGTSSYITVSVVIAKFHTQLPESNLLTFDSGDGKKKSVRTKNRNGLFLRTADKYYSLGNNISKVMGIEDFAKYNGFRAEVDIPKCFWGKIGMTWNKGDKIIPFNKIKEFNTGDPETGVYDYLRNELKLYIDEEQEGVIRKKSDEENKLSSVLKQLGITDLEFEIVDKETSDNVFVNIKDNKIIFNKRNMNDLFQGKGVFKGVFLSTMIQLNKLSNGGSLNEYENFINNLNL